MSARAHALLYFLNELGRTDRTSSSDNLLKCRKLLLKYHARIKRGDGVRTPPLKNHKKTRFLSNTGLDRLKNHKAAMPEFNDGPSSALQRNAFLKIVIF